VINTTVERNSEAKKANTIQHRVLKFVEIGLSAQGYDMCVIGLSAQGHDIL
jgi:hypothetical protein